MRQIAQEINTLLKQQPRFSPDGRWLAYESNESGRFDISVTPYPGPGGKTTISTGGGTDAVWSRAQPDSRDLNIWRLARQRGVRRDMTHEPELSRAVYRCIACDEASRCDAALAAERDREIDAFCPNRGYFARIEERHRHK